MRTSSTIPDRAEVSRAGVAFAACLVLGCLGGCANRLPRSASVGAVAAEAPPAATVVPATDAVPLDAVVRRLASRDFEVRARAARTLVQAKAAALPALGRAGAMPIVAAGGVRVSATRPVLAAVLAEASPDTLAEGLTAPWPNVRQAAAAEVGTRDRWSVIPRLIERLDDPVAGVRAASVSALRRLTNNFFGFRAEAQVTARAEARDRWRTWWSQEGRARARDRERGPNARLDERGQDPRQP